MNKTYQQTKRAAPSGAVDLPTAVAWLKEHVRSSFDETIELHIHLNIDPSQSEHAVRGQVVLPSGTPKSKRVAVFVADSTQAKAAREAGAAIVGGEELIAKIAKEGSLNADLTVASPDLMPKIAAIARILGPKGLMPNPKTGTVSPQPAKVVQELLHGRLSFKMDALGNIHETIGKASWETARITANGAAIIEAVRHAKPLAFKGQLIKSVTLASTMSPGIRCEGF